MRWLTPEVLMNRLDQPQARVVKGRAQGNLLLLGQGRPLFQEKGGGLVEGDDHEEAGSPQDLARLGGNDTLWSGERV